MQQHVSKYFVCRPPTPHDPEDRKIKIHFFQKMVMLHIRLKGITEYFNMVANILPPDPNPLTLGVGPKVIIHLTPPPPQPWGHKSQNSTFYQNMVMLHIKLKENMNAATL